MADKARQCWCLWLTCRADVSAVSVLNGGQDHPTRLVLFPEFAGDEPCCADGRDDKKSSSNLLILLLLRPPTLASVRQRRKTIPTPAIVLRKNERSEFAACLFSILSHRSSQNIQALRKVGAAITHGKVHTQSEAIKNAQPLVLGH